MEVVLGRHAEAVASPGIHHVAWLGFGRFRLARAAEVLEEFRPGLHARPLENPPRLRPQVHARVAGRLRPFPYAEPPTPRRRSACPGSAIGPRAPVLGSRSPTIASARLPALPVSLRTTPRQGATGTVAPCWTIEVGLPRQATHGRKMLARRKRLGHRPENSTLTGGRGDKQAEPKLRKGPFMSETNVLNLDVLKKAVEGPACAFRCRTRLQPAGGQGDKVFPPTYAGAVYAVEQRRLPGPSATSWSRQRDDLP